MNIQLLNVSIIFLILFAVLSFIDGVYLHLIKYKLQENKESRLEHLTHSFRAILFIPMVALLFYWNVSGLWLWILMVLISIDLVIEAIDVLAERKSRSKLGGLSSGEYLLHVILTTTRVVAFTLALGSKPSDAWVGNIDLPIYSDLIRFITMQLIPGAVIIAILHIVLIFNPTLISKIIMRLQKKSHSQ